MPDVWLIFPDLSVSFTRYKISLRWGFAFRVSQMNDCPRRYAQKNAAYRSASLVIKPHFGEVFAFWAGAMPDGAVLIRPTGGETGFVGRIRCLHRHPAEVLQRALRLVFEDAGAYFLLI